MSNVITEVFAPRVVRSEDLAEATQCESPLLPALETAYRMYVRYYGEVAAKQWLCAKIIEIAEGMSDG